MAVSRLYERILDNQLIPQERLEEVFQEASDQICEDLGIAVHRPLLDNPSSLHSFDSQTSMNIEFENLPEPSSPYFDEPLLGPQSEALESHPITQDIDQSSSSFDLNLPYSFEISNSKDTSTSFILDSDSVQDHDSSSPPLSDNSFKESPAERRCKIQDSNSSPRDISALLTSETLERFEKLFLERLVSYNLINTWQAELLKSGYSNFMLGGYRIIDLLGEGGNGKVFLGRNPQISSNVDKTGVKFKGDVAIKVLPISKAKPESIGQFLLECEISKRLNHPNIIKCYAAARSSSIHYSVSEYVNAGDSRKLLAQYLNSGVTLYYRIVCYIILEAAKGLDYLHRYGLIHRDVKPGNILLTKTGKVKLGDFGMVCPMHNFMNTNKLSPLGEYINNWEKDNSSLYFGSYEERMKKRQHVCGTPDYLSPDQILNPLEPSPSWDIYSLGCSLYLMLTGIVPYPSNNSLETLKSRMRCGAPPEPSELNSEVPKRLSDVVMAMLKKSPEHSSVPQIKTMKDVVDLLQPWVENQEITSFINWKLSNADNFWDKEMLESCFVKRPYRLKNSQSNGNDVVRRQLTDARHVDTPDLSTFLSGISLESLKSRNNNETNTSTKSKKDIEANPLQSLSKDGTQTFETNSVPNYSLLDVAFNRKQNNDTEEDKKVKAQKFDLATKIKEKESINNRLIYFVLFPILGILIVLLAIVIVKLFL